MPRKSVNRLGAARRRRARTGARGQPKPGATPTIRRFLIPVSVVAAVAAVAAGWALLGGGSPTPGADAGDPALVSLGAEVYGAHCAVCHGVSLEGQAGWRRRNADGTLPAPPHDATGHTWHHPDDYLFEYTRRGGAALVPAGIPQQHAGVRGRVERCRDLGRAGLHQEPLARRRPHPPGPAQPRRRIDQIAVGWNRLWRSIDRVNLVYTIEVERIGAFDWNRDAVPIKCDPFSCTIRTKAVRCRSASVARPARPSNAEARRRPRTRIARPARAGCSRP